MQSSSFRVIRIQRKLTVVNGENRINSYDTPTVQMTRLSSRAKRDIHLRRRWLGSTVFFLAPTDIASR